jgi:hypothetical protein
MKSATLPPVRIDSKLKKSIESVLHPGETLSSFVHESVANATAVRQAQRAFVERGLASERRARRTGRYVSEEAVFDRLDGLLARAKRKKARTK